MTDLALFLFIGGLVAAFAAAAWPLLVIVAIFALAAWLTRICVKGMVEHFENADETPDIVRRCDEQHAHIMAGNDVAGTYGAYLPPPGLR